MNDELDKLSESMKKLRMEYDKYFMGVERLEPIKARDEVKKHLRRLITEPANNNTARRFRLQSLQASLVTYESYWNRIARQIEEGTFKRDKLRAQAILRDDDGAAPEAQVAPTKSAPEKSPETQYPESIRKLHEAFERTRQQLGSDSKPISIAALAATVHKQMAAIQAQYKCKTVEFKVAVKDGRPILKAVPK